MRKASPARSYWLLMGQGGDNFPSKCWRCRLMVRESSPAADEGHHERGHSTMLFENRSQAGNPTWTPAGAIRQSPRCAGLALRARCAYRRLRRARALTLHSKCSFSLFHCLDLFFLVRQTRSAAAHVRARAGAIAHGGVRISSRVVNGPGISREKRRSPSTHQQELTARALLSRGRPPQDVRRSRNPPMIMRRTRQWPHGSTCGNEGGGA